MARPVRALALILVLVLFAATGFAQEEQNAAGEAADSQATAPSQKEYWIRVHGILMSIGWVGLLPGRAGAFQKQGVLLLLWHATSKQYVLVYLNSKLQLFVRCHDMLLRMIKASAYLAVLHCCLTCVLYFLITGLHDM